MNNLQISMFNEELGEEILRFRQSITPGFNTPQDIIPYKIIEQEIFRLKSAIRELQYLSTENRTDKSTIIDSLKRNPLIFEVIRLILALILALRVLTHNHKDSLDN